MKCSGCLCWRGWKGAPAGPPAYQLSTHRFSQRVLIKEIANSGHLDAIAVFFTTFAVYLAAKLILSVEGKHGVPIRTCLATVVAFSGAVGAKLYPIVLAPIFALLSIRTIGFRRSLIGAVLCSILTGGLLLPMAYQGSSAHDPSKGVKTFLKRWEMNDFLFMLAVENLRPDGGREPHAKPWFTVVPNQWRESFSSLVPPFLLARGITLFVFFVIAASIATKIGRTCGRAREEVASFIEGVFLTLAWFWLLAPTQNPWYWTWAIPFLPFAKNRAWLWVSGIVFAYYLRFWFTDHYSNAAVLGSRYAGPAFFDFVVTWIEFLPWFLFLLINWIKGDHLRDLPGKRD
jgi:hypothetical protein